MVTNETVPNQQEMIAAAKQEASNHKPPPKLPRLGVSGKSTGKTMEVELADAQASVLIKKPAARVLVELDKLTEEGLDMRQQYELSVELASRMIVEPEVDEERIRELINDLSVDDWMHLQEEMGQFSGLTERARRETESEFQEPEKPAEVPVSPSEDAGDDGQPAAGGDGL